MPTPSAATGKMWAPAILLGNPYGVAGGPSSLRSLRPRLGDRHPQRGTPTCDAHRHPGRRGPAHPGLPGRPAGGDTIRGSLAQDRGAVPPAVTLYTGSRAGFLGPAHLATAMGFARLGDSERAWQQ